MTRDWRLISIPRLLLRSHYSHAEYRTPTALLDLLGPSAVTHITSDAWLHGLGLECERTGPFSTLMKDIPVDELADISSEVYEAAQRVGCTDVSITGKIWPGATATGAPEDAARFVEFSWHRAAIVNGEAVFEDHDPKRFLELLIKYGLEDNPTAQPLRKTDSTDDATQASAPKAVPRALLSVEVSPETMQSLESRAAAAGRSVGEFLDLVFGARS